MNAAAPASLTARLAALIAARPITAEDYRAAALFTLDALANALAGRQTAPGRILPDWAAAEPLTMGREALLLGGLPPTLEAADLHRAPVALARASCRDRACHYGSI